MELLSGWKLPRDRKRKRGDKMTIFFIATTIVCGLGWLSRYVSCVALIYYIEKKGYKHPTDEELKACTQYAVKHLFR